MSELLCDIYRSSVKDELYLYVDKTDGLSSLPKQLLLLMGKPILVTTMLLAEDKKLSRAKIEDVIILFSISFIYIDPKFLLVKL